ncbi:MAG: HEAT repeat domain-containing protein [Planctomycetes bacterium]|nr:HEAT repeat domain-containing protein [Planctomycetota bacterium]
MAADISGLIRQLKDFRTRTQARDLLVEAGQAAVEPLIRALDDRAEGVRWSAVKCLGEIGDMRAAGPLVRLLGDESVRSVAAEALEALTGQALGADAEAWASWLHGQTAAKAKAEDMASSPESDRQLVAEALKGLDAKVTTTKDGYAVVIALEDDRSQRVRLVLDKTDSEGCPLIICYSECAPATPDVYEWALRKNLSMPYAALGIRDAQNGPMLVMFSTLLKESTSPKELRKAVLAIARRADSVEKALTQQDVR